LFYIVYRTTNLLNGKIYIGIHETNDLDDGYLGSGVLIQRALAKYGRENFSREILFTFVNRDATIAKEAELVTEEFVAREDTYNLTVGGYGGFHYVNKAGRNIYEGHAEIAREHQKLAVAAANSRRSDAEFKAAWDRAARDGLRRYFDEGGQNGFAGKSHSEETKKLIGSINAVRQRGSGNSQYGTCWVHNVDLKESRKVPAPELATWEAIGWKKGRKIKW
jgi:hypothetical protein